MKLEYKINKSKHSINFCHQIIKEQYLKYQLLIDKNILFITIKILKKIIENIIN